MRESGDREGKNSAYGFRPQWYLHWRVLSSSFLPNSTRIKENTTYTRIAILLKAVEL